LYYIHDVKKKYYELVEIYLKHGGNPLVRDGAFGQTALHRAAFAGDVRTTQLILNYYKKYHLTVDMIELEREDTPLSLACAANSPECVALLLNAGANPFCKNMTYLRDAYARAKLLNNEEAIQTMDNYAKTSFIDLEYNKNNKTYFLRIRVGSYGVSKEHFFGSLFLSTPPQYSPEKDKRDLLLKEVNEFLENNNLPLLSPRYEHGHLIINIDAVQAYYLLNYLELLKSKEEQCKLTAQSPTSDEVDLVFRHMKAFTYSYAYPTSISSNIHLLFRKSTPNDLNDAENELILQRKNEF
jgi:hypothetical protein